MRSMTGFGREQRIIGGRDILFEIRSVNHRYYEFSARLPRQYAYLEEKLKTLLGGVISRGKIEVSLSIYGVSGKETLVTVNQSVVESYVAALRSIDPCLNLADNLSLADVFKMTDAFNVVKADADEEEVWEAVRAVASAALDKFAEMRGNEGERIKSDILEKLEFIEKAAAEIDVLSPANVEKYRAKLFKKISEIIANTADEQRILLEAAIFAEKTAVDEETVRLKSHIAQARQLINENGAVGRKLDFLIQEMNREINTIGSKAQELSVTRLVVDLKSELEKIREQVQNIE